MTILAAVKDRMINHFHPPFTAQSDKWVLAALMQHINNPEAADAISQAPHHFEVWIVGAFNHDTGQIEPRADFLTDCASLVRAGFRTKPDHQPSGGPAQSPDIGGRGAPGGAGGANGTYGGPVPHPAPATAPTAPGSPQAAS